MKLPSLRVGSEMLISKPCVELDLRHKERFCLCVLGFFYVVYLISELSYELSSPEAVCLYLAVRDKCLVLRYHIFE